MRNEGLPVVGRVEAEAEAVGAAAAGGFRNFSREVICERRASRIFSTSNV